MDKVRCKAGQVFECQDDINMHSELSGRTHLIKKGTKMIVGNDGLIHFYDGTITPIPKEYFDVENGFDAHGISIYLYYMLNRIFSLDDMLGNDIDKNSFIDEIKYRLCEIGID